jgi:hypothetical protein
MYLPVDDYRPREIAHLGRRDFYAVPRGNFLGRGRCAPTLLEPP